MSDHKQQPTNCLTPQQASAALQFMQRATLQGAEVPAFVEVVRGLSAITEADLPPNGAMPYGAMDAAFGAVPSASSAGQGALHSQKTPE